MAALVPDVTDITARLASFTASEMIDAINDEIVATSTLLSVDAYTLGEGLTIGFTTAGEDHQINLRKTGANTIAISVEPSGSITDPGDSVPTAPTGTSADWSGAHQEPNWDVSLGTPSGSTKVWLIELPDAIFVLITDSTNTYHINALHAGRIANSTNSASAPAAGQDGLGYMAGVPDNGNGSTNDWLGTNAPCCSLHWATNEWTDHIAWLTAPASSHCADYTITAYRPLPPGTFQAVDIGGSTSDAKYGESRYIRCANTTRVPLSTMDDLSSNQAWLHYNDAAAAEDEVLIWDKSVTP